MNKASEMSMVPVAGTKAFPWKCGHCGSRSVAPCVVKYTTEIDHDGRAHTVTVDDLEVPRCGECGEMILDDAANRRITEAFRDQIGLLHPLQIRQNREALGLTQKQLAGLLGIAEATLSRWETGAQVQQRALDKLLRLFFTSHEVREILADDVRLGQLPAASAGGAPVARSQPRSRRDTQRAAPWSRLAAVLGALPAEKEEAAVAHLSSLVELMLGAQKPEQSPTCFSADS